MTYSPIAIKRRMVLGDLYPICENLEQVPVHLENADGEKLGFVDESLGHYADAYLFHLPEDVCKKLSTGQFIYSFDYEYADPKAKGADRRIQINGIYLTARRAPEPAGRARKSNTPVGSA
ncbi:MAG: hypothetical protein WBO10_05535 [Pyrinomonadaceae bacterium]